MKSINTRLGDQKTYLDNLGDIAITEGVNAVIIAGDIYHSKSPTPAEEDVFAGFIARLFGNGIHIFAIAGNHERSSSQGKATPLTHLETLGLPTFHLLAKPSVVTIEIGKELLSVVGIPWPLRSELEEAGLKPEPTAWDMLVSRNLDELVDMIPNNAKAVLTGHFWTSELAGRQTYSLRSEPVVRAGTIARERFSYIALGHIHRHEMVWSSPPVVYSGSIDRTDFSDAGDAKGVVLVELDSERTSWRFIETPVRSFVTIEMDISGFPSPVDSVAEKAKSYPIQDAVVRIKVKQAKGDPPLDTRSLRPKLEGVYYLKIERQVVFEGEHPLADRTFTPLSALEEYISLDPKLTAHKDKLLRLAAELAEQIE